jgi:redox-sensitive bicupin YhaK (pirin superfamily)
VRRSIGTLELDHLDPFLLLDHFGSPRSESFGWGSSMHHLMGIERLTYMLTGFLDYRESRGCNGRIGPGDVRWLTAGRGITCEETPSPGPRGVAGLQLWAALPATLERVDPYSVEIASSRVPEVVTAEGARVRVIAGRSAGVKSALSRTATDLTFLDVSAPPGSRFTHQVTTGQNAFVYLLEGGGRFGICKGHTDAAAVAPALLVLGGAEPFAAKASPEGARFIFVAARPLRETAARQATFGTGAPEELRPPAGDPGTGTNAP